MDIKKAYWITSRIQFDDHFQKIGSIDTATPEEEIKDIYENYYKEKYKMNNYQSFYWKLRRNSLFFLAKEKRSFNKYVRTLIEDVFVNDEKESKDVMTLYRISKDMAHASGYNFNATSGMVDVYAQKVLLYTYKLIIHFVLNASETLAEHNIKTNVSNIIAFLQMLSSMHTEAIEKIFKEHTDIKDNM